MTTAAFARYAAELGRLSEIVAWRFPEVPVSELPGYDVLRFVEDRIVRSGWLRPYAERILGR